MIRIVTLGDSVMWGQGLAEINKYPHLVAVVMSEERNDPDVEIRNFAKSGASLGKPFNKSIADTDPAGVQAGDQEYPLDGVAGELPDGPGLPNTPNCFQQLRFAWNVLGNDPGLIDIVMVSAGANDILIATLLNPLVNDNDLVNQIDSVCNVNMGELLTQINGCFPNATIVVAGYYPIISKFSALSEDFATLASVPLIASAALTGTLIGLPALSLSIFRLEHISRLWTDQSDAALAASVVNFNSQGTGVAVFARSRIGQRHTTFAIETRLWSIDNPRESLTAGNLIPGIAPEDEVAQARIQEYRNIDPPLAFTEQVACEFASVGHPNGRGAQVYAESIIDQLRDVGVLEPLTRCRHYRQQVTQCEEIDLWPCEALELLDCADLIRICPEIRCNQRWAWQRAACRIGRAAILLICRPLEATAFAACELTRAGFRAGCDLAQVALATACQLVWVTVWSLCELISVGVTGPFNAIRNLPFFRNE